jgi:NitT/TauT family transport system permease protein
MAREAFGQGGLQTGAARLLSLAALFLLWTVASYLIGERLCPGPVSVFGFVLRESLSGELPWHLGITLLRVTAAFIAAMVIGTAIGLAMGRIRAVDVLVEPWIILLLSAPALIVIVLSYLWIGLTETAAIVAVALNKIPNVAVTVREGARTLDPAYADVARVYRFSRRSHFVDIVLPQLQPYLAAAARSGLALIWKIVLVVELLGRSNGVGFQVHLYFQMFDVRAILGYTVAFVSVMLAIEFFLVQPLEAKAYRWRPRPA